MKKSEYEKDFLDYASKFDAMTNECGKISECAKAITERHDHNATKILLNRVSLLVESDDFPKEVKQIAIALNDSLLKYFGRLKILDICDRDQSEEDGRSLPELLADLNNLIGLSEVKTQVNNLISYQKVQKRREEYGLIAPKGTLHLAFIGGPGTGKTTVARIVGRIYKQIGLLSRGHFIEASRLEPTTFGL